MAEERAQRRERADAPGHARQSEAYNDGTEARVAGNTAPCGICDLDKVVDRASNEQ